jgi:signal transduction histidine kinase
MKQPTLPGVRIGLRFKFIAISSLLFFILALVLTGFSINRTKTLLETELKRRGLSLAKNLARNSQYGVTIGDARLLQQLVDGLKEEPDVVYVIILDSRGIAWAHTDPDQIGKPLEDEGIPPEGAAAETIVTSLLLPDGGPAYDVAVPIEMDRAAVTLIEPEENLDRKARIGWVRIGLSLEDLQERLHRTLWISILLTAGVVAIGIGIFFFLVRWISTPVEEIARAAVRIADGDFDHQIRVSTADEVGVLAQSFNRMSRELGSLYQDLENQVKARTQELESFVYTVSHDLKSPVVSMQGMASLFLQDHGDKVDQKGRYYLERIVSNAHFMEDLINGLLILSRVGRKQETPERMDVREVLQGILDRERDRLVQRNIRVVIQAPLPEFVFDRIRLTQVFENLITNAAKFMGDQPSPEIEIGGSEGEGWVEFYVKDNGIGIDPAYHEKVFGIFQRLKEVEVEGTGVGLAIVKKIVDLAGGKIGLESEKGKGTTFRFRLPRSGDANPPS